MKLDVYTPKDGRRKHFEPLRSITEMAEEFGVSRQTLVNYIRHHNGPKPEVKTSGHSVGAKNTYYKPGPMRLWWKQINEEPK